MSLESNSKSLLGWIGRIGRKSTKSSAISSAACIDAASDEPSELQADDTGLDEPLKGQSIQMIQTPTVNSALKGVSEIEGHVASALVDFNSGMCLGSVGSGNGFDINVAAAGNTDVVRSKMKVMKALGINGGIEDILITLDTQYHLIRMIKGQQGLFLYVALRRANANLAMARLALTEIERAHLS
jgi:hypothetical protein